MSAQTRNPEPGTRNSELSSALRARNPATSPAAAAALHRPVRAALDRCAPAHLQLPSGRRAAVDYGAPAGPTVAAPLQEFFGLVSTPNLGAGGVPVVLELLAPNRRPVQVTRDLASFWANVYPKVRSELRRRYPRHAWPEDPLTAVATASPLRRRPS